MRPTYIPYFLIAFLLASGCTAPMGTSLLVSGSSSCSADDPICASPPDSTSNGDLAIQADPIPAINMDQSDVVDVTGTCVDLGRKKNRILVEVFAGDSNEAVDPYITNQITSNCYHVNGAGQITSSGLNSNEKCFWVTKGVGLVEDAGLPSQKDFPQCHDGQFGFSIKLGKILTDTTGPLGINYLVRYKLLTTDGGIADSGWTRTIISRQLTPPKILSAVPNMIDHSCNLAMGLPRFNPYLQYSLNRDFKLLGGGAPPPAPPPVLAYTNVNTLSASAYKYEDYFLVDGVNYNYTLNVTDTQYAPYIPALPLALSAALPCKTIIPQIFPFLVPPSPNTCSFYISPFNPYNPINPTLRIKYEIGSKSQAGWSAPNSGVAPDLRTCTSGNLLDGCNVSTLVSGKTYYFAVRSFRDTNVDGKADPSTQEVGEWSSELNCRPP